MLEGEQHYNCHLFIECRAAATGMKAIIAGSWDQSRRSSMDASSSKDVVAPQPEHVSPQSLSGKHAPSGGGTTLSFVASGAPDPLTKQTLAGLQLMGKALSQIMEELHVSDSTVSHKYAILLQVGHN